MIDLKTKLAETEEAMQILRDHKLAVPEEAYEICELIQRALTAEEALAKLRLSCDVCNNQEALPVPVNGGKGISHA